MNNYRQPMPRGWGSNMCDCEEPRYEIKKEKEDCLSGLPLAMAYVPWQCMEEVYEPCHALQVGTIFPELNKPFKCYGGGRV